MAAPVGPKKVHRYTVEFKIQTIRLSLHPEIQTQDVAHALDIHPFMLSKWKKDYRDVLYWAEYCGSDPLLRGRDPKQMVDDTIAKWGDKK